MNELVKLTGAELAANNIGVTFTLKEISDKFNVDHKNAKRDFDRMINSLTDDNLSLLNFEHSKFEAKTGKNTIRTFDTYTMDMKTMVWFLSKFDHNLRAKVVDYAFSLIEKNFEKLEEKHNKEVKKLETNNKKEKYEKFN